MKQPDPKRTSPETTNQASEQIQARIVHGIGLILAVTAAITGAFALSIGLRTMAWQPLVLAGSEFVMVLTSLAAVYLSRRGRLGPGAVSMLAGLALGLLCMSVLVSGAGLFAGLLAVIFFIGVSVMTLPQKWVPWATLAGVAVGVACGALDLAGLAVQIEMPALQNLMPAVIGIVGIVFAALISLQFRSLSLANKLLVVFLVVTILVAGVVTAVVVNQTSQSLTETLGMSMHNQALTQAEAVGDLIQRQVDALVTLSLNDVIQDEINLSNLSYTGDSKIKQAELIRLDDQWKAASQANDESNMLVQTHLNNVAALDLKEYRKKFPNHVEIFATDQLGGLVAATNMTSDYYQADEGWWKSAFGEGKGMTYISPPEYDESAGAMSILIAVPVRDRQSGALIGILRTTYVLNQLTEVLNSINLGETGDFDLLFHGDPIQMMRDEGDLLEPEPATLKTLESVLATDYVQIEYEGDLSLLSQVAVRSATTTPAIDALGWRVVLSQDLEEALRPVNQQTRSIMLLVMMIAGVAAGGAVMLAQVVARPINRLTTVAERVREGDLNAQAQVESNDEVGQLGATFNEMTARLRDTLSGLEQRVAERTRELTLSGEVGRTLAQERDLDRLMEQAVEAIQSTFDLYYTQIYLTDPSGAVLFLRAGSGEVGAELMRRSHRLQVGLGSINGQAAVNKRPMIVSDTATSAIFKANPLLPETRSEMAVPLLVGERVGGVLDMQSSQPGTFSEESLPVFEALAGQLAIAIENAELFAQAQQARAEVERQAQRLTQKGWVDFLDAVERSERLGYMYDQGEISSFDEPLSPEQEDGAFSAPIEVMGEAIGAIQVERTTQTPWSTTETELVHAVADQVARQAESLRLLSQAERYRAEAEAAAKRLTREGWRDYLEGHSAKNVGFVYDQAQVLPDTGSLRDGERQSLSQPLQAHGTTIGELSFDGGETLDEGSMQLIQTVAERLSAHIENLRLTTQTQAALTAAETLYTGSEAVVHAPTIDAVLQTLVNGTALKAYERATLSLFDKPWESSMPEASILAAAWARDGKDFPIAVGTSVPVKEMPFVAQLSWDKPTLITDLRTDERVDEATRARFNDLGASVAIFPLLVGKQSIGVLVMTSTTPISLTEEQLRQINSLVGQAAAVVQGIHLLEQSQKRARREQVLRQVTERVRSAIDPDVVLRTAAREVGSVLGRNVLIRLSQSRPNGHENGDESITDLSTTAVKSAASD